MIAPLTDGFRTRAQERDAHICPTPEILGYRRNAIAGMKYAQEDQAREAYAKWKKEKASK